MILTDVDGVTKILPNSMFGHKLARALWGKDLLKDFAPDF